MTIRSWIRKLFARTPRTGSRERTRTGQLTVERLEERTAPATNISFTVNTVRVSVLGANETATLAVNGTNLSVTSNTGDITVSGGAVALGFTAKAGTNLTSTGSIAA